MKASILYCKYDDDNDDFLLFLTTPELLQEIEQNAEALLDGSCSEGSSSWKKNYFNTQRALARCQDSGDEKLQLLATISEHIENRTRLLDQYRENLGGASSFLSKLAITKSKILLFTTYADRNIVMSVFEEMCIWAHWKQDSPDGPVERNLCRVSIFVAEMDSSVHRILR